MAKRNEVKEELDAWNKISKLNSRVYVELNLLSKEELTSMSVTDAASMCVDLALDHMEDKEKS